MGESEGARPSGPIDAVVFDLGGVLVDWDPRQAFREVLPVDAIEPFLAEIDFPACHRILKSVHYRGWVCVDLDTARLGPLADYKRCGDYVVNKLQPIYL